MSQEENKFPLRRIALKCYTVKELRMLYGVPPRTFTIWLAPIRKQLGLGRTKYLTVSQVEYIFKKFGIPGKYEVE
jgi:hypothetical protein